MRPLWFLAGLGLGLFIASWVVWGFTFTYLNRLDDVISWFGGIVGNADVERFCEDLSFAKMVVGNARALENRYEVFFASYNQAVVTMGLLGLILVVASGIAGIINALRKRKEKT